MEAASSTSAASGSSTTPHRKKVVKPKVSPKSGQHAWLAQAHSRAAPRRRDTRSAPARRASSRSRASKRAAKPSMREMPRISI